jgi:hypothetical protein
VARKERPQVVKAAAAQRWLPLKGWKALERPVGEALRLRRPLWEE